MMGNVILKRRTFNSATETRIELVQIYMLLVLIKIS